jgi:hypothetical protein
VIQVVIETPKGSRNKLGKKFMREIEEFLSTTTT